ncbi:MAG TPA: M20/M25/M40 family metallo-hydrolase, partial [Gemmatimonadaceae bacterium]|nr:M20/M25/M40 family metallo-hydrolase [Gemmatimonadaceae bacterium]
PGGPGGRGGAGGRGGPPVSCRDTAVAGAAPAAGGAGAAGGRAGGGGGGGGRGGGRAGGRGAGPAAALSEAAGIATISGDQLPVTAVGNAKRPASAFVKNPAAPPAAPPSGPTALTITARAAEVLLGAPIASATKGIGGRTVRSTIRLIEQPAPGGNVVGIIEGSDSELRSEVVLVDAHYDHLGVRTPVPPATDSIFNGADDDASGTTAVIEIARAIKAGPAPRRTLVFLATTGEEVGLLGTNWFIANPARPLSQMVANLEIEMINRPDSLAGGPGKAWLTGYERSTMGDFFAAAGLPIGPDKRPEQNFFMRSDNIAFARMGVPAHTLSSFDLHDDYHRANDEVGLANFEHMAAVINAGVSAVRILADGKKPEWYPGCKP